MREKIEYDVLQHENKAHENIFVVDWCLSSVCNYSCAYCPEMLHDHKTPFPDLQTVLNFCRQLRESLPDRTLFFQFTGGEVTLWKDLPRLLRELRGMNCKVGIISNGSRAMSWWVNNVEFLDHVCISFHPEFAKLNHFVEVAQFLAPRTTTHANIMMWPQHFTKCLEAALHLKYISDLTVALQPLIVDFGSQLYEYTSAQLSLIHNPEKILPQPRFTRDRFSYRGMMTFRHQDQDKQMLPSHEIIGQGWNQWKGWKCYAGVEQLVVNFSGDVYRGWCFEGGKIGNIKDDKIEVPKRPVDCTRNFCHCNLDIMTKKTKSVLEIRPLAQL